jgi:sugar lactone lactonase YvrE
MHPRHTFLAAALVLTACAVEKTDQKADTIASVKSDAGGTQKQDATRPIATPTGFVQPEAVRYDPDQDLYFVSNFGKGDAAAKDNNGFISQMNPDGQIVRPQFIVGGSGGTTLHAPRGMTIVGDTLWVVDADAVRGFNRRTGAPVATADFSAYKLGFLNDITAGPDALYVTDTGTDQVYRVSGERVTVALHDKSLGGPNGITWDAANRRFIIVPYGGDSVIRAWTSGGKALTVIGKSTSNKFDGVEVLSGNRVLASSQGDSSLHLFTGTTGRPIIKTGGAPADIAVDTKRNRVAVPFVDRSAVEIWQLPTQ